MTIRSPVVARRRRWGRTIWHLLAIVAALSAVVVVILTYPASVAADEEPSIEAMLERLDAQEVTDPELGLPESTTNPVNVDLQWGLWKRSLVDDRSPALASLERLRHDARSVGLPSMPYHQLALIDVARHADDFGLDEDEAISLFGAAHDFAPHLPYARLERVHWQVDRDITSLPYTVPSYLRGLQTSYRWLDSRVSWTLKYTLILLIALALGFVGFLFAQLLRYFGIAAYDGTRLLPRGFSSTQTVILLVALVLVPGLVLQSPLLSFFLLSLLVIPFQQLNERFVVLCFFLVLAALPWVDDYLGQLLTYPESEAQQLLHANYHGCDDDCRGALEQMAEADRGLARLVERIDYFRGADKEELKGLQSWFDEADPVSAEDGLDEYWLILQGATEISLGNYDDAIGILEQAIDVEPEAVEAWFNLARAHQLLEDGDSSRHALGYATRLDADRSSLHMATSHQDPHSFLMVPLLDADTIWDAAAPSVEESPSLVTPLWAVIAGKEVDLQWGRWLGLAGIALLLLTTPFYLRRRVSTPCPKCGLARDPTDTEETGDHHYCLPCYQTFVSGASLDYHARIHSEATLGRRDRLQRVMRRIFSLVSPGLGHVLAGHAIRGIVAFVFFVTGLLLILLPTGPFGAWSGAFELFRAPWSGSGVLAWVLISIGASLGLTGLLRGIEPTRRPAPESNTSHSS